MESTTLNALLQAYIQLCAVVEGLYTASLYAVENGLDTNASQIAVQAESLFDEAESILLAVTE